MGATKTQQARSVRAQQPSARTPAVSPAPPTTPERAVLAEILLALGAHPRVRIWRQNTIRARAPSGRMVQSCPDGTADILGLLKPSGRLLAIEVKSASGRVSAKQSAWGEMISRFGGLYVVARSSAEALAAVESALSSDATTPRGAR